MVRIQLSYEPTDELTQKAVVMLESAMRSKSQLVALALCEFADKYGFQIDNTEEIKTVIKNYDYLSRAIMSDVGNVAQKQNSVLTPSPTYHKKDKPKRAKENTSQSVKMIPCETTEITSEKEEVIEEITTIEIPQTNSLNFNDDIVVSDRAMQSMSNVLAMFSQG